jgi:hypothetical protein
MGPTKAMLYTPNKIMRHSIFLAQGAVRPGVNSYRYNGFVSEFGPDVFCAFKYGSLMSTLRNTISYVVGLCSNKQVFWINTESVVATVKHKHSIRDWAVTDFPRDPVGTFHMPSPYSDLTVPPPAAFSPIPTSRFRVYFNRAIESIKECFHVLILAHRPGTVQAPLFLRIE